MISCIILYFLSNALEENAERISWGYLHKRTEIAEIVPIKEEDLFMPAQLISSNRNLNNLGITLLLSMQNPCWSPKPSWCASFTLPTFHLHFVLFFPSFYRSSCASIPSWWALSISHPYIVSYLLNIMGYLKSTLTQCRKNTLNLHTRYLIFKKGESKFTKEFDVVKFAKTKRKLKMLVLSLMDDNKRFLTSYQKLNAISLQSNSNSNDSNDSESSKLSSLISK